MRRAIAVAAVCMAAAAAPAHAGRSCDTRAPRAVDVERALELAADTARALDASGASVVVLARNGQDLSRHGQRWSHLGLAYRSAGGWRVVHKLNHCGAATASVYRQGLGEFFLDDLFEYRAGYVVLQPALQARLLPLLHDDGRVALLHQPAYSLVAYPWSTVYQQSNQWAIETLALAQETPADSRPRAQAWLRWQGYEPAVLRLNAVTRLGARMSAANIAFDDHPNDKRYADRIETVTVDSVFAWLGRSGLGGALQTVR